MTALPVSRPSPQRQDVPLPLSIGLRAVRLAAWAGEAGAAGLICVADDERRAEQLAEAVRGLAPDLETHLLPPWDCLAYDSAPPSREIMGQRMAVLRRLAAPRTAPCLLIASPAALVQRVPPRSVWGNATYVLEAGETFSMDALEAYLHGAGYILDERVDEPGEAAIRGQVIDIFPPQGGNPCRAEHDGGVITRIRSYDPLTQRTGAEVEHLVLEPASEVVLQPPDDGTAPERFPGMEHRLPDFYPQLETAFDYLPDARLVLEERTEERLRLVLEQIADAFESRAALGKAAPGEGARVSPERLFVTEAEWRGLLDARPLTLIREAGPAEAKTAAVPRFVSASNPGRALAGFVAQQKQAERTIVFAATTDHDLRSLRRRIRSLEGAPEPARGWDEVLRGPAGAWWTLRADLTDGFVDEGHGIAVVTAADLLGSRARRGAAPEVNAAALQLTDLGFRIGDAVIHIDHGIGVLEGIEAVSAGDVGTGDTIRLGYADDAKLMVPVGEIDRIWRYGSEPEALTLDKLNGASWPARRAKVEVEIREAAKRLADLVQARRAERLEPLVPPRAAYERFVARFPFPETPDQTRAIEDVLRDLASGRPMDRLVCGDVGFGKTEIALRAAAAAALAGKQVAVVAPTTVLARQHLQTFRRRFAGLGLEVGHLSRLVTPGEAKAVKKGLADGTIRIVVGTHALAGKGVAFKDLGLLVIDEEQRFGVAHKAKLRNLAAGAHVLTLTATPIPRTLQAALVGLQELSIIATPPARRQPIRTVLGPFDPATVRDALLRERRRGGQSFVVCPQIADIEPLRERLAELVPALDLRIVHGQIPPAEADDVMVRFADGQGDVLLATNIIESGLDVPRANTILVWRADRFGLSQLHQIRGRVGRGRVRGTAFLFTEPGKPLHKATEKRLRTLEALDRLGAGFAISAQDLDLRGAGSLLGEEQAGHVKLIGADLYQDMLKRALQGRAPEDDWTPDLNIGLSGMIPTKYVSEPEVRINLYARIARLDPNESMEDLGAEIEDRFGAVPEPVQNLLDLANLKRRCSRLNVARIDAGPQAVALTFRPGAADHPSLRRMVEGSGGQLRWSEERLVFARPSEEARERQELIGEILDRLDGIAASEP